MKPASPIARLISGGQTGVDRAALDAALEAGFPCGGWCPRGRKAEDGPIDPCYPLEETPTPLYGQRTKWNVRDSDGTLVLTLGIPKAGTALALRWVKELNKPCLLLELSERPSARGVWDWARQNRISILNVAGPRESTCPGVYKKAHVFMRAVLSGERIAWGPW